MIHKLLFLFFFWLKPVEFERNETQGCSNSNPLSAVQLLQEQKQPELLSSCCNQKSSALTQKSYLERQGGATLLRLYLFVAIVTTVEEFDASAAAH